MRRVRSFFLMIPGLLVACGPPLVFGVSLITNLKNQDKEYIFIRVGIKL